MGLCPTKLFYQRFRIQKVLVIFTDITLRPQDCTVCEYSKTYYLLKIALCLAFEKTCCLLIIALFKNIF